MIATGYELSRLQSATDAKGKMVEWTERVLLVHSPVHEQQQQRGLDQRISSATAKLAALTPSVGRGKRQIRELEVLQHRAQAILKAHRLEGLLEYTYEYHPATQTVGERYQITAVTLNTTATLAGKTCFWLACLCYQLAPRAVIIPKCGVNLPRGVDCRAEVPSPQGQVALSDPIICATR